ncbi:MAG: Bifunctional protein FolD, partial [Berkelbacteria bacterium GW2011_GWB1_38_5]
MVLYGQPVAEKIYQQLSQKINELKDKKIHPDLAIILVGDDLASIKYVKAKEKIARKLGVEFHLYYLKKDSSADKIISLIKDLNNNKFVNGIVVQLPLPSDLPTEEIIRTIDPKKDIDGFSGQFSAPTAEAIIKILSFYNIDYRNKKIVIIGHGILVGKPLAAMLKSQGIEAVVCDSKTNNLKKYTLKADILVTATGVKGLINQKMITSKTVVIDAGASESEGRLI